GGHRERDPGLLAGLQGHAGEADEAHHRPGGLRDRVVQIALYDLGTGPAAGVAHGDLNGHLAVDRPVVRLPVTVAVADQAGAAPLEAGVSEPESERERGGRVDRGDLRAPAERRG